MLFKKDLRRSELKNQSTSIVNYVGLLRLLVEYNITQAIHRIAKIGIIQAMTPMGIELIN